MTLEEKDQYLGIGQWKKNVDIQGWTMEEKV